MNETICVTDFNLTIFCFPGFGVRCVVSSDRRRLAAGHDCHSILGTCGKSCFRVVGLLFRCCCCCCCCLLFDTCTSRCADTVSVVWARWCLLFLSLSCFVALHGQMFHRVGCKEITILTATRRTRGGGCCGSIFAAAPG